MERLLQATGALADIQFRTDLFPHMKGCIYTTWDKRHNSDFCFRLKRHSSEFQHKRVSKNKAQESGYCSHWNQAAFGLKIGTGSLKLCSVNPTTTEQALKLIYNEASKSTLSKWANYKLCRSGTRP